MDHLADSIAKLSQGRKNWYIGREGIPVDDSPGEKCEPVIVFDTHHGSVYRPKSECVWIVLCFNKVLGCWDSYKVICDLVHQQKSTVYAALV